jgi:hypothetical protein
LAQSRHPDRAGECPLSGVKRTSQFDRAMSASDPFQTLPGVHPPHFRLAGLTRYDALSSALGQAMRRRDFVKVLGSAAAMWPFAARAQQREPLRRVAFLDPLAKDTPGAQERYTAFLEAFEQLGWTPGRNVRLEARWGGGDEAAIRKHAAELVALAPDVLG